MNILFIKLGKRARPSEFFLLSTDLWRAPAQVPGHPLQRHRPGHADQHHPLRAQPGQLLRGHPRRGRQHLHPRGQRRQAGAQHRPPLGHPHVRHILHRLLPQDLQERQIPRQNRKFIDDKRTQEQILFISNYVFRFEGPSATSACPSPSSSWSCSTTSSTTPTRRSSRCPRADSR